MRVSLAIIFCCALFNSPDEALARHHRYRYQVFRWPWEVGYRPHHRHRETVQPPNCDQINEAVRTLDAEHLDKALNSSNDVQRETIAKCQTAR